MKTQDIIWQFLYAGLVSMAFGLGSLVGIPDAVAQPFYPSATSVPGQQSLPVPGSVFVRRSNGFVIGEEFVDIAESKSASPDSTVEFPYADSTVFALGDACRDKGSQTCEAANIAVGGEFVFRGRIFRVEGDGASRAAVYTGKVVSRIVRTFRREVGTTYNLQLEGAKPDTPLTASAEHPFYSPSHGGYTPIAELLPGDTVVAEDGQVLSVAIVTKEPGLTRVFNVEVEQTNNFFAQSVGKGVLVHNNSAGRIWSNPNNLSLPIRTHRGAPTHGIANGISHLVQSGRAGYGASIPRAGLSRHAQISLTHVEGHVTAWQTQLRVQHGIVRINHLDGPCPRCLIGIPELLPEGYSLTVLWGPNTTRFWGVGPVNVQTIHKLFPF